jgi:hypothetical protein
MHSWYWLGSLLFLVFHVLLAFLLILASLFCFDLAVKCALLLQLQLLQIVVPAAICVHLAAAFSGAPLLMSLI